MLSGTSTSEKRATCGVVMSYNIYSQSSHTDKPFFVILILTSSLSLVENKSLANPTTYIHNGVTCLKCPTGTRVSTHCTRGFTQSSCVKCEPGTYHALPVTELKTCGVCDRGCPDMNAVVVHNCTSTRNLRCECDDGYYDKHHALGVMACVKFTKCPPGQIIVEEGGPLRDVVCDWCPRGQFYNDSIAHCSDCTLCSSHNQVTISPCTKRTDAVCGVHQTTNACPLCINTVTPGQHEHHDTLLISITFPSLFGVLLLFVVCGIVWYMYRRKKNTRRSSCSDDNEMETFIDESPSAVQILPSPPDKKTWADKVFLYIPSSVHDWKNFLRHLPVPAGVTFNTDLEIENNTDNRTQEKIYQILRSWYGQCYDVVSMEAIQKALEKSGNKGIVNEVIDVYNKAVKSQGIPESSLINVDVSHTRGGCDHCSRQGIAVTSEIQHLTEDCPHRSLRTVHDTDQTFVKEPLFSERDDHTDVKRV